MIQSIKRFTATIFSLACLATAVQAAVPLGTVQTFDTLPVVADWSTLSVAGGAGDITTIAALDTAVTNNTAATAVATVLPSTGTQPISQNALARWNSSGFYLQTRPTGNNYLLLMATLVNSSGGSVAQLTISYDWGQSNTPPVNESINGHRAFYSTTGTAGSWILIPEFSTWTANDVGSNVTATLNLGGWAPNANLYILWVDDNGPGSTTDPQEGGYKIDNFYATPAGPPTGPTITSNPPPVINVVQGRTTNLTVTATGSPPLTYQWYRGTVPGTPIDGATSRTYTISNAQPGVDDGTYYCAVSNPYGGPINSTTCQVTVNLDTTPPGIYRVIVDGTGTNFVLSWNEPVTDSAKDQFNYSIYVKGDPGQVLLFPSDFVLAPDGTNVAITTLSPALGGLTYTVNAGNVCDVILPTPNCLPSPSPDPPSGTFFDFVVPLQVIDTEVRFSAADTPQCDAAFHNVDGSDGTPAGPVHVLMKFDVSNIPAGANINGATLTLVSTAANADSPDTEGMYLMNQDWDCSTTWNNAFGGDGIQAGVECDATPLFTFVPNFAVPFTMNFDLRVLVQEWVNGLRPNFGMAILPGGNNGYRFESSQSPTVTSRPRLVVDWDTIPRPPVITSVPAGYTNNEGPGVSFTLTVGVTGSLVTNQWYRVVGGVTNPLPGETGLTIVRNPAVPADSGQYFLQAGNAAGVTNSPLIPVLIIADTNGPALLGATSGGALTTVRLVFSESVGAGAESAANYQLINACSGAAVSIASVTRVTNNAVDLGTTLTFGTSYKVTALPGVTDLASTPNPVNVNNNSALVVQSLVLMDWNHAWRFATNDLDAVPTWTTAAFDDSSWSNGVGLLGWETGTPLANAPAPLDQNYTNFFADGAVRTNTVYFRAHLNNPYPSIPVGVQIRARHYIDDAIVFHLNGAESFRFDLAPGPVTYATKGTNANEAALYTNTLPTSQVVFGDNIIACDLHTAGNNSSDTLFGIQILATYPHPALTIRTAGSNVQLNWTCGYKLWQTTSLASPITWTDLQDTSGSRTITPTGNQQRFYLLLP